MTQVRDNYRIEFVGIDKLTDVVKRIERSMNKLNKSINNMTKNLTNSQENVVKRANKQIVQSTKNMNQNIKKSMSFLDRWKKANIESMQITAWWALSLMFFGFALQRFFEGIIRGAVGAFQRIMEMSDLHGHAIERLSVAWEYLKFVIGSAINSTLGPLIPTIFKIIDKIADWIDQNQQLVGWLLIIGLALAIAIMFIGQFVFSLSTVVGAIRAFLATVGGMGFLSTLLNPWTALIGILVSIAFLFEDTKKLLLDGVQEIFDGIKKMSDGLFNIFKGLILLMQGKYDEAFLYFKKGALQFLDGLVSLLDGLIKVIIAVIAGLAKAFFNAVVKPLLMGYLDYVKSIIDFLASAASAIGLTSIAAGLRGVSSQLSNLKQKVKNFQLQVQLPEGSPIRDLLKAVGIDFAAMAESIQLPETSQSSQQQETGSGLNYTPATPYDYFAMGTTPPSQVYYLNVSGLMTEDAIRMIIDEMDRRSNAQKNIGTSD